jgi:tetratricopeptide (TPR) repeat protein
MSASRSARARKRRSQRTEASVGPATTSRSPLDASPWIIAALVLLTVAVFAPVGGFEFVRFDDPDYVTLNDHVRAGLTWEGLRWAFTTGHIANWHPLTWLSHMLDVQLFGVDAGAHHLVNLCFHAANAVLLFLALRRMTGAPGRSVLVAALFAIHPLHVESVAWVSERKDVLSTFFWMLTLIAYARWVERPAAPRYATMLVLFALGLLSKPMVVTLPLVLLLLDVWPLARLLPPKGGRSKAGARSGTTAFRLLTEKLPLFALALLSAVVTVVVQSRWGAVGGLATYPLALRLENAAVSYVAYLAKLAWPASLSALYPYRADVGIPAALGAGMLLLAITFLAVRALPRRPWVLVGWLWFVVTLLPVIGIIQAGLQSMADRYTYVPAIGVFAVASWGGAELVGRLTQRRAVPAIVAGLFLVAYAIRARAHLPTWKDSVTLWSNAVDATGVNAYASYNLGVVLVQAGRTDEGIARFEEALRIQPDYADVRIDLANALRGRGAFDAAIREYETVVRLRPTYAAARLALADALRDHGRAAEAVTRYREALKLDPTLAIAHNEIGNLFTRDGRFDDAYDEYAAAVRLDPGLAEARNNLGGALVRAGKVREGLDEFLAALRLKPGDVVFHYNAALAYERLGRSAEAIEQLHAALRADPAHAPSLRALGRMTQPAARE